MPGVAIFMHGDAGVAEPGPIVAALLAMRMKKSQCAFNSSPTSFSTYFAISV
jgi:hypothetical protein